MNVAKLHGGDVQLHYLEKGNGSPVVFVHGGLQDYRQWLPQIGRFAEQYRVVTYSRRYNYPNVNQLITRDHSALVDSYDLVDLIHLLGLPSVHLIGHSYGAYAALFAALDHPDLVRSLVLAEPPVHRWLLDDPQHAHLFHELMTSLRDPVAQALKRGNSKLALQHMAKYFIGPQIDFELLPSLVQSMFKDNLGELEALMTSSDAFPDIQRDRMRQLATPLLLLTGDRTLPIHRAVNDHLERLIRVGRRVTFQGASHNMWLERTADCEELTLAFLKECDSG
jgi:pimeloyl-ACP methyl ester carboxylesterase